MSLPKSRPKKIQQYQVLDLLGKGGNGVVYKGIDMLKGTFVAIKQIVIEKTQIKNIKFQINVLKQLNDPFIVKYIDAIQNNNKIYLILEYLEGGSLGSLVQKTPLEQKLVKKYIKQVLKGLQYLHKHHVAHRDLKGTNILLTKQGKAKITDFGVAIQVNDTQKTLSSAGTPYWMAPQAIVNQSSASVQCDIWSLGCTVIQLLTGNPPYHDLMPYPALFRIVQDMHPPIPQNLTISCADFLMRCFVKDPKKRAKASQLLKHKWIKQGNQHKSSSFSVDIQNIVFENDTKISTLIKTSAWQQLYELTLNTTNKKTIYYNKSFILINKSINTDGKLKFIKQLIIHNHQALKYLSLIGVVKKMLNKQIRQGWRITKLKMIEFICDSYELCEQNNDLSIWLSDCILMYKSMMQYMAMNENELPKRIVHVAKMIDLLYKLMNSSLLIDEHLMSMLQQSQQQEYHNQQIQQDQQQQIVCNSLNAYENVLKILDFILGLKNSQMSYQVISIIKKHIIYAKQQQNGLKYYVKNSNKIIQLVKIAQCFYDFRVLFELITLLKILVSISQLRNILQNYSRSAINNGVINGNNNKIIKTKGKQEGLMKKNSFKDSPVINNTKISKQNNVNNGKENIILVQVTKTLNKLMTLPTITMQQHQILLQLIQFLIIYFNPCRNIQLKDQLGNKQSYIDNKYIDNKHIDNKQQLNKKQVIKQFIQLGGIKLLTSMPQSYRKNQKIHQNVTQLIELMDV